MKIDTNSNVYTVVYSVVIVVIVAVLLTVASTSLKPAQKRNQEIEKKENILKAVNKAENAKNEADKASYIEAEYEKYIVETYLVDSEGNRKEGDAFKTELRVELVKPEAERSLPVFVCKDGDKINYVLPLSGAGLWGPIWGYVAFESDLNTIAGATFDHAGETPGLGAEITTNEFMSQFKDKTIFKGDELVSITIQKPGPATNEHTVDGISGGTITSVGVQDMIADNLKSYKGFISKIRSGQQDNTQNSVDSTTNDSKE